MKIVVNLAAFLFLFILIVNPVFSQRSKVEKADLYYNSGEYFKAQELYTKAYAKAKDKSSRGEISFKIGMCSRKTSNARNAEMWFRRAVTNRYQNPLMHLYLADALRMGEKYEDALVSYANYKDLVPNDPSGEMGILSCNNALEWIAKPTRWQIMNARFFNDKESDFGIAYGTDSSDIFMTSAREGTTGKSFNDNSGMSFTDIFYVQRDKKGKWSTPVPIKGSINTAFDEGTPYVMPNGRKMYYTSCKSIKNQNLGCQIYYSEISSEDWGKPEQVILFKDSSISVGHPFVTDDDLTMYFVAEHPNGLGGKDIWVTTRKSATEQWSTPQNMGNNINTPANDMYPFLRSNGMFYFSSDGYPGMGGLDILEAKQDKDKKWTVENLKVPVNSAGDDFGIRFFRDEKVGYLCSNRQGSRKDDIYYFWQPPINLSVKGVVKNEKNGVVIEKANVKMTGSDGTQVETIADANGRFAFELREKTDYLFVSSKPPRFLKGVARETTKGIEEDKILQIELFMTQTDIIIEIENIEYDFGKADLREESKVALNSLVELLEINNNITIELRANTDFRGSDVDNLSLSERRATSVVNYLISKGVKSDRLVAKGLGETTPTVVTKKQSETYPFLRENDVLSEAFILKLATEQEREIAHQLNRRTEFKVLSTDYKDGGIPFGSED